MQFWRQVLAGSLGVLGVAAFLQGQAGNDTAAIEARSAPAAAQRPRRPIQPNTYVGTGATYYNIDAFDLMPLYSNLLWNVSPTNGVYATTIFGDTFRAALHLPSGAQIVSIELDYSDTSPTWEVTATLWVCDYTGTNCLTPPGDSACDPTRDLGATVCSGATETDGEYYRIIDLTGSAITVNNYYNRYFITARNTSLDFTTAISRISIGYKLQVSPGPATASFTDVPTTHPFFKFVEALHAAGITGGYPDGRFGVNDPVTRGQMAVFLSVALGLNWP